MRMPPDRARHLLEAARVARLATVGKDGSPHIVPVTFALEDDLGGVLEGGRAGAVTAVDDKPKTTSDLRRLRNIRENPRVCLLVDHYEDDWTRLWWVRADGRASVVESGGEWAVAVERLREKYGQYRERPPSGPVILIRIDRLIGWSYA